ncbi:energy-coupling factor transporter transmembrane protein EcfT [Tessaracoccus rhinocerotis]|uniref:Energy-coupling factor transporter transmembrane protein EcfT n=1 Tax=Tessaracoccus rhinocerotis TaxID=1689449 RepID=A0A553K2X1_9ACTN|nr:energy-coupling factor transporter transmembrane component T [Tessaracoccus rhinocerotis]TRY19035.1 energy-coupling factor transporter transmembrane protein EcfT [Tessaracoccus rhinocerotis]
MGRYFLPRPIHPFAWWVWAIALAVAANGTTNPLLLAAIVAVASLVTFARRGDNPWARGFMVYLVLGAAIVVVRVAFRVLFGGGDGPTVLLELPEVPLPWWVQGIRLLGPISLEAVLAGLYDGLRLATMIICLGAANSLANPKRLLASLPGALYELGTILVVAIGVFPQLGESVLRVHRARKLRRSPAGRGRRRRHKVVETILIPVLSDALERSLRLAASMDVRGYGRHGTASTNERRWTTSIGLAGLVVVSVGAYLHLSRTAPGPTLLGFNVVSLGLLFAGGLLVALAMRRAGRTVNKSTYRPIRWQGAEWLVVLCGSAMVAAVTITQRSAEAAVLVPAISPPTWPELTTGLLLGLLAAALPAFLTPAPSLADVRVLNTAEGLS